MQITSKNCSPSKRSNAKIDFTKRAAGTTSQHATGNKDKILQRSDWGSIGDGFLRRRSWVGLWGIGTPGAETPSSKDRPDIAMSVRLFGILARKQLQQLQCAFVGLNESLGRQF